MPKARLLAYIVVEMGSHVGVCSSRCLDWDYLTLTNMESGIHLHCLFLEEISLPNRDHPPLLC